MPPQSDSERITNLEELCAHLERTISDLNDVVVKQAAQIDRLSAQGKLNKAQLEDLRASMETPRSAADERPPHY